MESSLENSFINVLYFPPQYFIIIFLLKYEVCDLAKSLTPFLAQTQLFFVTVVIFLTHLDSLSKVPGPLLGFSKSMYVYESCCKCTCQPDADTSVTR